MVSEWLMALEAAIQDAQEAGHVVADIEPPQLAFELHSLGMGANWAFQLYQDAAAFDRARSAIRQRLDAAAPLAPFEVEVDEGAARRTLRTRSRGSSASWPRSSQRPGPATTSIGVSARPGAPGCWTSAASRRCATISRRASRRSATRSASGPRATTENRATLEEMVADPAEHKWRRVSNDDLGEDGCKHYHSTPRLGLVGMLMGWWRVKISSGCP